jgi:hypothetical protein
VLERDADVHGEAIGAVEVGGWNDVVVWGGNHDGVCEEGIGGCKGRAKERESKAYLSVHFRLPNTQSLVRVLVKVMATVATSLG